MGTTQLDQEILKNLRRYGPKDATQIAMGICHILIGDKTDNRFFSILNDLESSKRISTYPLTDELPESEVDKEDRYSFKIYTFK